MRKLFLATLAFYMTACSGSGGGGSSGNTSGPSTNGWTTFYAATASALPTCSGDVVGRLYYVEDQANFQVCKSTGWAVIQVGNAVTKNTRCYKVSGSYSYELFITDFTNGDKFVSCNVWGNLIASSNSIYWKSTLNGAVGEFCTAYYDIDTASAGWWKFETISGTRKVTYTDTGSASNGTVITYASGDCTVSQ